MKVNFKRVINSLIFLSFMIVSTYQGCAKPFKQLDLSSSSLSISNNYELKLFDSINSVDKLIPLNKPELVTLLEYKAVVSDLKGKVFNGKVDWSIKSIPENSCELTPSEITPLETLILCGVEGSFILSAKIQPDLKNPENVETLEPSFSILQESTLRSKGNLLYQNNCNSCHSSSGSGYKKNKTPDEISAAIYSVFAMNSIESLKNLSPTEIRAIALSTQPNVGDNEDPFVSISSPSPDQIITGVITVDTIATDNVGVLGVRWQVDNIDYGVEDLVSPYSISLNANLLSSGPHTLKAIARDGTGNLGIATVPFNVSVYDDYSVPESVLASTYMVTNDNILAGEALYASKCLGCHAVDAKRDRSYSLYRQMVGVNSTVQPMKSIDLISSDLYKIFIYLNNFITGDATSLEQSTSLIGTRTYVASYFQNIFVSYTGTLPADTTIKNLISNLILKQAGSFGGACQANDAVSTDTTCKVNILQTSNGVMLPQSSALRRGYITRACEEVLSVNQSIESALEKVGLNSSSQLISVNIEKVYDLFMPGRPMPTDVKASLMSVASSGDLALTIDKWRFVLYSLCRSAGVESF